MNEMIEIPDKKVRLEDDELVLLMHLLYMNMDNHSKFSSIHSVSPSQVALYFKLEEQLKIRKRFS